MSLSSGWRWTASLESKVTTHPAAAYDGRHIERGCALAEGRALIGCTLGARLITSSQHASRPTGRAE